MIDVKHLVSVRSMAARIIPPSPALCPASKSGDPGPGQLWATRPISEAAAAVEPYCVLVLNDGEVGPGDKHVYLVAPLHRATEMAGPDDVILPQELLGHRVVVCLGASVPALRESLSTCLGSLPDQQFTRLKAYHDWMLNPVGEKPRAITGVDYLDEQDLRFTFKQDLGESLDYLQGPAIAWAEECGLLTRDAPEVEGPATLSLLDELAKAAVTIVDFLAPPAPEYALAADSTSATRELRSWKLESRDSLVGLILSEAEQAGWASIEVTADPMKQTDLAVLLDGEGNELATITSGAAYFRMPSDSSFVVRGTDGGLVHLHLAGG